MNLDGNMATEAIISGIFGAYVEVAPRRLGVGECEESTWV